MERKRNNVMKHPRHKMKYFPSLLIWICFPSLLILILASGCLQDKSAYVNHPRPTDSRCIYDIQRAKKDIQNGKIVFTQSYGFGSMGLRYEEELRQLCKTQGLVFDFDMISCLVFAGQTQGCYGSYMDEVIFSKFGSGFKEALHRQADSLFLVNIIAQNKIIQYWDCDERPRLPNDIKETTDYMPDLIISGVDIKDNRGEWPLLNISFVIERDSTLSDFYVTNFVAKLEENEKYKDQLFARAVESIKEKYPVWVPGTIKGVPVRTNNIVRIVMKRT